MQKNPREIDLDYRPRSYFWSPSIEKRLLTRVKGVERREALKKLLDVGQHDLIPEFLSRAKLSNEERRALGKLHPMLMGGEYLPDTRKGEVEIARISLQSTTGDVFSVYARPGRGCIHYRVVDEHEGELLGEPTERESKEPLTLKELYDFFMGAWSLHECLDMNAENSGEHLMDFVCGHSEFYDHFGSLVRQRAEQHLLVRAFESFPITADVFYAQFTPEEVAQLEEDYGSVSDSSLISALNYIVEAGVDLASIKNTYGPVTGERWLDVVVEKCVDMRERRLLPFLKEIEELVASVTASWPKATSYGSGIGQGMQRTALNAWIEAFVLAHGRMPAAAELGD